MAESLTGLPTGLAYAYQMYERYGGLHQSYPLTPDEQMYDDTCREIDGLEAKIGAMPMAAFKASEFIWFSRFVSKMHMFPKQPQLDRQLTDLRGLLASLEAREQSPSPSKSNPSPTAARDQIAQSPVESSRR